MLGRVGIADVKPSLLLNKTERLYPGHLYISLVLVVELGDGQEVYGTYIVELPYWIEPTSVATSLEDNIVVEDLPYLSAKTTPNW